MKKFKSKGIIISLIVLVMIIAILFPRLGEWLVAEDDLIESDIIVVLMGSVSDRILEAVDIYDNGFANQIVMVNSYMPASDNLLSSGVQIPGNAQLSKNAANSLGVSDEDILILDGQAKSTQDESILHYFELGDKPEEFMGRS